ncbi:hypothetical protein KHA94_01755 [Bacillus sp. FJAT-49705]|uniref:Nicotinate phosphoribosyltransferase C-terminal domain-containing protein n=1 Tax=Cytobacillus citreus TaxID=2833586 RepID=A0ABS5NMA0_9BACI|nr:hypothetical protein [Cytobacillus citreus]
MALEHENPQEEERLKMFHPVHTYISKFVTNFTARELHEDIFVDCKLVYVLPTLQDIRRFVEGNLNLLWDKYKRLLNPEEFPVDLSQSCWDNKMNCINEIQENLQNMVP